MSEDDYETTETLVVEPHVWTQFAETPTPDTLQWRCGRCKFHYRLDHPWCLSCGMRLSEPEPEPEPVKPLPYPDWVFEDDHKEPSLAETIGMAAMLAAYVILGVLILVLLAVNIF